MKKMETIHLIKEYMNITTEDSMDMDHSNMDMSGLGEVPEGMKGAGVEPLKPGTEVIINAGHMNGMDGATAKIDTAKKTTVYMIGFTSTNGEVVTNHKWVTESELSAK